MTSAALSSSDARARLKDAALGLFVTQGLGASTAAISKAAGVSTGLLFHHFGSKAALVAELYGDVTEGLHDPRGRLELIARTDATTFAPALEEMAVATWRWSHEHHREFQFVRLVRAAAAAEQVEPMLDEHAKAVDDGVVAVIRIGQDLGVLRQGPTELVAAMAVAATDVIADHVHRHPDVLESDEEKAQLWSLFWGSIAA